MGRQTYRIWLDPIADAPILERLDKVPNVSAFINHALALYLEECGDPGTEARQVQVHVTDESVQDILSGAGRGQTTRILHAALWFYLGRMAGVDEQAIAEAIINRLQGLGWTPGATPMTEEVPSELDAFVEQF